MLNKFLSYIKEQNLVPESTTTLLAVSGGKDSMALTDLMLRAGLSFHIGHINHHLRGEESDGDAAFVKNFCITNDIPYYEYNISPDEFTSGNIHDKARKIRYQWLHQIAKENHCHQIATAHHRDDVAESFLINLIRGSGLKGLSGIPVRNGNIVRPLLFASSDDIIQYVGKHNISYREDSSNSSDKYLRNKIRHHILPNLYEIDGRAKSGLNTSIQYLSETSEVFDFLLNEYGEKVSTQSGSEIIIQLDGLKDHNHSSAILFALIRDYGFNFSQCEDIITGSQGSTFIGNHVHAYVHQDSLIIVPLGKRREFRPIVVTKLPHKITSESGIFVIENIGNSQEIHFKNGSLYLDADSIQWPIEIRKRQPGDRWSPLGMKGKTQKVKDYLIHRKLSIPEKEKTFIISDQNDIIAIFNLGISEKVKMTPESQNIIRISWEDCKSIDFPEQKN